MSKELEVVRKLQHCVAKEDREALLNIEQVLERFEAIENADLSEALECANKILSYFEKAQVETMTLSKFDILTIKLALIQGQKDKNELAIYKLAYEWACNSIEGNPYTELLDGARQHIKFHKNLNKK